MARTRESEVIDWEPVTARALAFLCPHYADMRKATLLEQADFLGRFGLPYSEAAVILDTSEASLRELARQRGKKKSTAKTASKKSSAKASRKKQTTAKVARGRNR